MKSLLAITAAIEAGTGVALAIAPSTLVHLLLGSPLDSAASLVIGRILGAAVFTIGMACWFAREDVQGRAARGIVRALLLYNFAAASLLGYARVGPGMSGIGLLPAIVLHAVLAVWCIASLRIGLQTKTS